MVNCSLVLNLVKKEDHTPSTNTRGSTSWWLVTFLSIAIAFALQFVFELKLKL